MNPRALLAVGLIALIAGCSSAARSGAASTAPAPTSPSTTTTSTAVAATTLALDRPEALAVDGSGGVLIANQGSNQIIRWAAGHLGLVAGSGRAGFSGDGGPAAHAELSGPGGLVVAQDGTLYVADTGNNRIRAIVPSGVITTAAGDGRTGSGTGTAVAVPVGQPVALAVRGQSLYIVDDAGVQLLSHGVISTLVAAGPGVETPDGTSTAFFPSAIAIDPAGDLYVANSSPKGLMEFNSSGHVVGHWLTYVARAGLVTAPDDGVVVADYGRFSLDRVVDGTPTPVVAFADGSIAGVGGGFRPSGVAVAVDGTLYAVTDGVNGGTDRAALITVDAQGRVTLLTAAAPWCRTSQLALTLGDPVSEPTGQNSLTLVLTNASAHPCGLLGYPTITLTDAAGKPLPFTYDNSGDQVVTDQPASTVTIDAGMAAYVMINKYRCDLGDRDVATGLALAAPEDVPSQTVHLDLPVHRPGYCGPRDPGSTVSVSPVEPSVIDTIRQG